jgi:DNA-binding MarR family transcriptional regulator
MATLKNTGLFGTRTRTNTLLVVHMLRETHPSEIANVIGVSLSQAQRAVDSLEQAGVLVGAMEGRARRVRISPRFPAATELRALLDKLAIHEVELQRRLAEDRRRPRRAGKAV